MFYQGGYLSLTFQSQEIKGWSNGLGGLLNFYLSDHINVGIIGGTVTTKYDDLESYYTLGYGGASVRYYFVKKKWRFSFGMMAGGGGVTLLNVDAQLSNNMIGQYIKEGSFIFAPLAAAEFCITPKISFIGQFDYLLGPDISENWTLGGPKLQLGVLFNR